MKKGILALGIICFLMAGCGQQEAVNQPEQEQQNQEQQNQEQQNQKQQEPEKQAQITEESGE